MDMGGRFCRVNFDDVFCGAIRVVDSESHESAEWRNDDFEGVFL